MLARVEQGLIGLEMIENVNELLKAHEGLKHEVYLDGENSSVVPKEIVDAILPCFNLHAYGNPSLTHKPGWEAFEIVMSSGQKIASQLGCDSLEQITFTPGETEANNLALLGTTAIKRSERKKIIISEIEPLSVVHVTEILQRLGFCIEKIAVDKTGLVDLEQLASAVGKDTVLVSLATVNNEIGTIQPIKEATRIVKQQSSETLFHTDASDAYGRIPFNISDLGVDLATISSYKILGPRGVGALYVKEGVDVEKILEGQTGTQRLWPGVENTPLIAGFAKASELAFENFENNISHMQKLRDKLINGIIDTIAETSLNGPPSKKRVPDNVNISFLKCEGEALTIELSLRGVYVSSGSACTRRLLQPSHVLVATGKNYEEAHGSILMKVTRLHTEEDIKYVLEVIPKAVERLRGIVGSTVVK